MTILTALATLYDRMAEAGEAPMAGCSSEWISGEIVLDADGNVVAVNALPVADGNMVMGRRMNVPAAVRRSSNINSNFLWDKTAYALGMIAIGSRAGQGRRTEDEYRAFLKLHRERLADAVDAGLVALRRFLDIWLPEHFAMRGFPPEILDGNVVFRLDGDMKEDGAWRYVHERPAALELLKPVATGNRRMCLVTGKHAPVARLHPPIKRVTGAKSSGAALVSFNDNACESHGMRQGDNAPVSENAAFAYGAALNALLAQDSARRLQIGDSTVVFWAEPAGRSDAQRIEQMTGQALDPPEDDDDALDRLRSALRHAAGPEHDPSARIYILGLAPNVSRLSVRFWYPGCFQDFARNITRFWDDLSIEPGPWKTPPAVRSVLYEFAPQQDTKERKTSIPPLLGGELMRSVLNGLPYPRSLLSSVIMRIRVDGKITGGRAAICRAFISRDIYEETLPMSLDRGNIHPAYRLGRLFALLELIQKFVAFGLDTTIRDRHFASASTVPARTFPVLIRNAAHHLASLRGSGRVRLASAFESEMHMILSGLEGNFPHYFNLECQGCFVVGYHHQRWAKFPDDGMTEAARPD